MTDFFTIGYFDQSLLSGRETNFNITRLDPYHFNSNSSFGHYREQTHQGFRFDD